MKVHVHLNHLGVIKMTNTLKTLIALFVVFGFLAGCASKTEKIETPEETVVDETPMETVEEDTGPDLTGVATVFYFDYDQSILKSEARSALMIHADSLKASPRSIRLEGHADERGSREYNMALGERRANAVRDFLVLQGVDSYLIETISYGEERPLAVGSDEGSWSQNRRVELK